MNERTQEVEQYARGATRQPKAPKTEAETQNPLTDKEVELMNAYWRACNYLSVGMIYLRDNPLLKEPLKSEHVKHRLLGHWGTSPALRARARHRPAGNNELDVAVLKDKRENGSSR